MDLLISHFHTVLQAVSSSAHKPQLIYITTKPEPSRTELHSAYKEYDARIKAIAAKLKDIAVDGRPAIAQQEEKATYTGTKKHNTRI